MTHDSTNQHLSLEPDYDGFDPLEDFEDDATEVEGPRHARHLRKAR